MSTEVPVDAPWEAAKAAEYDQQTLETWIRANSTPSPRFRKLVNVATRPIFGADMRELSLLFVLFYIAASGNEQNPGTFERNLNTRDGAQMFRFEGGAAEIAKRVGKRLGKRVLLKSPARRIAQNRRGVTVYSDRFNVQAKRAIVAMPPALADGIEFRPLLPEPRNTLNQRLPQGTLIKVTAVYHEAFWRARGLNGTVVSIDGPVNVCYDDSPPSGEPGILFGLIGGDEAREFLAHSAARRRAIVLDNFSYFFGEKAYKPTRYFETNWPREVWSQGGPVGVAGPGLLLAYGKALREPTGRIHWAGTETSTYWAGYMDGAVRSGERAAAEVLARL
jgi:monoamine oxidase